jgi:hypothetical protein
MLYEPKRVCRMTPSGIVERFGHAGQKESERWRKGGFPERLRQGWYTNLTLADCQVLRRAPLQEAKPCSMHLAHATLNSHERID